MGYTEYNVSSRAVRAESVGYHTKSADQIFTQRTCHESMNPKDVNFRECRDSATHPNAYPVIIGLDETGSMGHIPHDLIKDGLPTLMSTLIQRGINDASVLFVPFGDHECDNSPLQVGQFESGDAELDMWLERTFLEGKGGGNRGESYLLPWYFAAFHTESDAWDKRKQKGVLITIGDEPCLEHLPISALKEIMGSTAVGQGTYTASDLLKAAQERYHVFHIFVEHGGRSCNREWKDLLGQNLIVLNDYTTIPKVIADTILTVHTSTTTNTPVAYTDEELGDDFEDLDDEEIGNEEDLLPDGDDPYGDEDEDDDF